MYQNSIFYERAYENALRAFTIRLLKAKKSNFSIPFHKKHPTTKMLFL